MSTSNHVESSLRVALAFIVALTIAVVGRAVWR